MNFVTKQLVGTIGPAVMKSVIKSMLTEQNLVEYRDKAIEYIKGQAEKTSTDIDDGLVDLAVKWIMEPGNYIEYTKNLCQLARGYVSHTATEYDDMLCLPILDRIEQLGAGQ